MSNPFSDSFDEDGAAGGTSANANPFDDPDSGAGVPDTAEDEKTKAPSNPFDISDVDFDKVQQRRDRARASKREKAAASDPTSASNAVIGVNTDEDCNKSMEDLPSPQSRKPSIVSQRSKTTGGMAAQQQGRRISNFFGMGGTTNAATEALDGLEEFLEEDSEKVANGTGGPHKVVVWPYDDYHLTQKTYYSRNSTKNNRGGDDGNPSSIDPSQQAQAAATESSIPIFSRPVDPCDIPTAVQGLSLAGFESKAEERSIIIVSTWLFDAGLIDELLVNGGMTSLWNSNKPGDDMEGPTKMDKEIAKLRTSTKRQLALINARLNDGVASTGSEVQELVNAVSTTKEDIGQLRDLSNFVSKTATTTDQLQQQFMLTNYPRLKQAINAKRNLTRCFRELDFFSHIPATCDRLREELHAGEWTAHEWSSLRSVCREHVELEIFLVEAEAGMKKRLEEEQQAEEQRRRSSKLSSSSARSRGLSSMFNSASFEDGGLQNNRKNDLIDQFLSEHVENVWELGDEIRLRIMSGIATSFDLAINNPAGMVALVEAVEVYETANDEYKNVHGVEAGSRDQSQLRFTDMRAAALGELYKDFETRGLDVFQELSAAAASDDGGDDDDNDEEATNRIFTAVIRAANELMNEIGLVKEHMASCFPPVWCIETLWTTCVAHICSNNILQQIGGVEGHTLPDLTVTQLLDLVAWVENFREIIEDTFPNITSISSRRTYFDQAPQLLVNNNKEVDLEVAKDSLAWVNNTLWDVHDLAKDEFLFRTKEQTEEWLDNVYEADHTKNQTTEGRLVTSLCEDVYSLAGVQLRTIRERLTRRSEALVQAVGVIFKNLYEKQMKAREIFCTDLETCCAASNDFIRMSDKCEEIVEEIQEECNLSAKATETLEEQAAALLGLYSSDGVYAAQKTHVYIFEPIEEAVGEQLFGDEWLNELTHNELAQTLVQTLDDFMQDLEVWLDEVTVTKTVEAQIVASVNFYIKCMLAKAASHNNNRDSFFENDNEKAISRMRGDISEMRGYFDDLAKDGYPTLTRIIEREFAIVEATLEIVSIAAGISNSDAQDFILVLQKRICNVQLTKFAVGDLYHWVNPSEERAVYELVDSMEETMQAVSPTDDKAAAEAQDRNTVPGLRLDQIIAKHCSENDHRKRPLQASAMDRAESALRTWRAAWNNQKDLD